MSASPSWSTSTGRSVGVHLVAPNIQWTSDYLTSLVAILGTTISPYLFFWQAEEEVEEVKERDGRQAPRSRAPAGQGRVRPHPGRHLSRHGPLEPRRAVHHHHHRRHLACPRRHQHPDLVAGGRGAAADRRRAPPSSSSPSASSAPACWRCPCSPDRPPTPWARPSAGTSAFRGKPAPRPGLLRHHRHLPRLWASA